MSRVCALHHHHLHNIMPLSSQQNLASKQLLHAPMQVPGFPRGPPLPILSQVCVLTFTYGGQSVQSKAVKSDSVSSRNTAT